MESKTNGRTHRTVSDWQEILDRFASSGRSLAAFCRTEGISRSTFDMWRRKLQPKKPSKKRASHEFVEVTPVSEPVIGGWTVEIELQQQPPENGKLVALPVLGGIHHDYRLAA